MIGGSRLRVAFEIDTPTEIYTPSESVIPRWRSSAECCSVPANAQRQRPLPPSARSGDIAPAGRRDQTVEFVVDTGFTGELTLPHAIAEAPGLPFTHRPRAHLADGTAVALPVYAASIIWHGREISVSILATGDHPLLGAALLDDCELLAQFRENGLVTIDELSWFLPRTTVRRSGPVDAWRDFPINSWIYS